MAHPRILIVEENESCAAHLKETLKNLGADKSISGISTAALALGISRVTLYRKLKKYDLSKG